jgi:16S rRNA (cytidine1402-2'-O)-methyltransferase
VKPGGGALILVATPIGNLGDLSSRAIDTLREADVLAAEDTRRTRTLLTHSGIPAGRRLRAVHEHNEAQLAAELVNEIAGGARVAYVTDAGMPAISDPGERLVRACLEAGLRVEAVPGPSAVLTALVLSGLPTRRFAFEGFLPRRGRARTQVVDAIATETRTVVLFESPSRLRATLAELTDVCGRGRKIAIARELTKMYEEIWRGTLGDALDAVPSEPRGEHVLVLGPADPADVDDDSLDDVVQDALDAGLSARDAAARAAGHLGVAKRRAYDSATRLARTRRS